MNRLIACGGTGAHVVLAMMRLHMLGYPLGFFRNKATGKPVEFPDLYLVDQDSGDGINELTAWQAVRGLIDRHPGRYNVRALGRESVLESKSVTPLPVGERKQWPAPPNNTLGAKFFASPILPLIASERQRGIDYSLGMMASPAVGSLLFKLKEYDNNPVGVNYDRDYSAMCTFNPDERVVVIGSSVGGTGSSVAPTLAEKCATDGAKVMAVMIRQWFKFPLKGKHYEAAYLRNKDMEENEASGLASYGERLIKNAAAVLVGVPEKALCNRDYEGDNQQPIQHSYAHDVAALAAMQHFTVRDPFEKGVYGLSASDKARLTDDISIGGDSSVGGDTLRDLVDKACVFEYMLEILIKALKDTKSSPRRPASRFLVAVKKLENSPKEVAKHLDAFRKDYAESLDWLTSLGIDVIPPDTQKLSERFYREVKIAERLKSERLSSAGQDLTSEAVAAEIFHWAAQWIHDDWSEGLVSHSAAKGNLPVTGYWPAAAGGAKGLVPKFGQPGVLAPVAKPNVSNTLSMLYDGTKVSQNGWPHPIAVVEQFRFSIKNQTRAALRQLEILLTGLAAGKFMLEKVEEPDDAGPSVSRLLKDLRENGFHGLASHRIVRKKDDKVLGFNSPWTLFCPIPGLTEEDWQELWCDLTGSSDGKEWETSQSWQRQRRARGSVGGWLKGLSEHISHDLPPWVTALQSIHSDSYAFAVGEWVSVYWGAQQDVRKDIPIPSAEIDGQASWDRIESVDSVEFLRDLQEFERIGEFSLCRNFHIPGSEESLWAIWKEHLDLLQNKDHIFAWRHKKDVDQLEILWDFGRRVLLKGMRVISEGLIRIPTCIPLAQDHVPGSARRARTKYPDLPLHPEYIGLAKTDQGEDLVELLVEGVSDTGRLSVGKAQPGPGSVTWKLQLKGRDNPLRITIKVDQPQGDERVRAHWMVWPGFRASKGGDPWRAYYMYAQATRPSLGVQALYVDEKNDRLSKAKKKNPQGKFAGSALSFDPGERKHVGGPPVALCAYDDAMKWDTGMYLVPLQALDRAESSWKLAVDFGTSHTVAATKRAGAPDSINLESELTEQSVGNLSLHISENWGDVSESDRALWRPTYITKEDKVTKALIPSDIFSIKELNKLKAQDIRGWEPVSDCVIPAMELLRRDLPEHILSDFKWRITHPKFERLEKLLREIYLGMALEIFVADMVRTSGSLPQKINATFTYPLRNALNSEAKKFGESLSQNILKRSSWDLGCSIELIGKDGLYSESHAARGGAKRSGEIIIVGDLGGGTLDMHISATDPHEGGRFYEVADSVKLGGNLLLDLMAEDASRYLPKGGGWSPDDSPSAAAKLRAYMRARGSDNLFGTKSAGQRDDALGLSGFEHAADGNAARILIDKYFWLISDYMARSLVAYIGTEWWQKAGTDGRGSLHIIVQLRGNGWRLWYDSSNYSDIQKKMQCQILKLAGQYWEVVGMKPPLDGQWDVSDADDHPKRGPILNVVNDSDTLGPDHAALKNSFKFPLSNLELLFDEDGEPTRQVNWFDRLPFENAKDATPQIGDIDPPVVLEDPEDPSSRTVRTLKNDSVTDIHKAIRKTEKVLKGTTYDAPIASCIWEKIFDSELTKGS